MGDYSKYGFELCNFEPDRCDKCGEIKKLYFGDKDYWTMEGTYLCVDCLNEHIDAPSRHCLISFAEWQYANEVEYIKPLIFVVCMSVTIALIWIVSVL